MKRLLDFFSDRKHRAPKGALRLAMDRLFAEICHGGQKAPSAKGCIKTWSGRTGRTWTW